MKKIIIRVVLALVILLVLVVVGCFVFLGSIVTKGGLVFIGGADDALYAFDKNTGEEVWNGPLPRRTSGTPMTYRSRSGRQFVLVTTGGGTDAALVAFALPANP